ncbi:MAG: hypothetical protein AAF497_20035, partial [Planctomycetota bacterium]
MLTKRRRLHLLCGLLIGLLPAVVSAQGAATLEKPKSNAQPATSGQAAKPVVKTETIRANNVVKLRERVGKTVTVSGKVNDTNTSKSGRHFLRFYGSELTVTCAAENAKKFKDGGPAKTFKGKNVEVTGKVELFKGKLQMQLTDP